MAAAAGVRDKCILGPGASRLAKGPDLSQLKPPIKTSLSGTKQIIHAMETGTGEVKNFLLNEINLMYECKTCFSVFRSIANLVAHKRTFCKGRYQGVLHLYQDKEGLDATEMQTVVIEAEPVECVVDQDKWKMEDYAPSYELLKTSGILQDIYSGPVINRLLPANKSGLQHVVSKLKAKLDGTEQSFYQNMERNFETPKPTQVVHLEPMYETENALMQSWKYFEEGETIGEQYRAWQEAEDAKKRIKIGPDGQVTTTKETIKLVTGPDGKTYSVKVPADAFVEDEGADSDEEESGYTKYPCPKCKKTYSKLMNVFNHLVNVHDLTMQEAKNRRKTIKNHAIWIEGKKKASKSNGAGDFSNPVKPMEIKIKNYTLSSKVPVNLCEQLCTDGTSTCPILGTNCVSSSVDTNEGDVKKSEELNNFVAEKEVKEKEEGNPNADVDRKIMEFVNRRKVECRICSKKFSRTLLVRNHVAGEHLKLKKWTCAICEFGSWTKQHCLTHAGKAHRLRDIESGVIEQPKEKYFDENPLINKSFSDSPLGDGSIAGRDNSDSNSTHSSSTTVTEDENDHFERTQINGINGAKQINLVGGLKSQQMSGKIDDSGEEVSDGDSEISFGGNAISPPSLSPASNSVSPQSPSPIEINEPSKRKRAPSSSPKKTVKTVKRTKLLKPEEDPVKDEMTNSSSNNSLISKVMMALPGLGWANSSPTPPTLTNAENLPTFKVPVSKKSHNIVRRVSNGEEDVLIKDLQSMESPITITSDSRGSSSSRNSDFSVTNSEVSSKSSNKARSRSRSSSETSHVLSGSESSKSNKSRAGSSARKK
eukprot:TRINITY_DN6961_c0_g1_i1.p1 TRINITY_DN6961_c0_g1~~TRINITY_DN6961_c0_g1_i1.p1  ORF type:complete len:820 (-),score=223.21 TRINITY_DN6961_c0_g1_i1:225-2684(-)